MLELDPDVPPHHTHECMIRFFFITSNLFVSFTPRTLLLNKNTHFTHYSLLMELAVNVSEIWGVYPSVLS